MSTQDRTEGRLWSRSVLLTALQVTLMIAAILVVSGISRSRVHAGAYTVCGSGCAYTSIQDAVDAASSGDTITIGPGVYHESIVINRFGGSSTGPYLYGEVYWSGGDSFSMLSSSDGDFQVITGQTTPQTIISNTAGTGNVKSYWGQSFTVPTGTTELDLQGFSFLNIGGGSVGGGTGYLFTKTFTGTLSSLSTATSDLIASASWDSTKNLYDFSASGVSLLAGNKYWFYSDSALTIGMGTLQTVTDFEVTLQGAGEEQTVLDGDNRDIVLRVGLPADVSVKDLTILNGSVPTYPQGDAYSQQIVLVNLKEVKQYTAWLDNDMNFQLLGAVADEPLLSIDYGVAETFGHWGQSFVLPTKAKPQKVTGFRFLGSDGATPAGAGTGYLFEGQGCSGDISCLSTSNPYVVASGMWNGSYYDLSASNYTLVPGSIYFFYSDTAFLAGMMVPKSDYNCGGAINNQGSLSLNNVTVADSKSTTYGGGICMLQPFSYIPTEYSSLDIVDSIIANNTSPQGGGGIYAEDETRLTIDSSFIINNYGSRGGGILSGGGLTGFAQTTITDTVIADNMADAWGGGIFNGNSSLTISDSWLVNNEARNKGGAIVNAASSSGLATLTVERSTIQENRLIGTSFLGDGGGGIFNGEVLFGYTRNASATIKNSTIHDNKVLGASGQGGGLRSTGKYLTISASTISGNEAASGGGLSITAPGQGYADIKFSTIYGNSGGGIYNTASTKLNDTIVANNGGKDCTWPSTSIPAINFAIISYGRNLDSDGSCKLNKDRDLLSMDPLLGPLESNGGPTWTHAPLPGSPVVDNYVMTFEGEGYLSGGATFVKNVDGDGNFQLWAKGTPPEKLVSYTGGIGDSYNYRGQSFTIPATTTNLALSGFNYLRAYGYAVSGGGTGYLFDSEFTGTVADLSTGEYLAKGAWNGSVYDFSASNLTLVAGKKYWFYADQPLYVGSRDTPNCPAYDQRGESRPGDGDGDWDAICDIGAVEAFVPLAYPGGPYVVNEGSGLQLAASGTIDPDHDLGALMFGWDFDDDGAFDDGSTFTTTLPFSMTLDGPGSIPIGLQVTDPMGFFDISHTTVQVANVAPTVAFSFTSEFVFAGETAVVEFNDPFDPGPIDTLAGFAYAVDCDVDGTPDYEGTVTSYGCVYSSIGLKPVFGFVEDKDGGANSYPVEVLVISPQEGVGRLANEVAELEAGGYLSQKEANSLYQLLDAALQKVNQGKTNLAISKLSNFKAKVGEYVADGVLTQAQGQPLIVLADRVIAAINFGP